MKDQYFGDINDYRKYGLLRILTEVSDLKLGVCWLRTQDDGSGNGQSRTYLQQPFWFRQRDPVLYDSLSRLADADVIQSVLNAEAWNLIPGATYFHKLLNDSSNHRITYFREALSALADAPLLFFDPDNGVEVKSVGFGQRKSSKYLYWKEIEDTFVLGHSMVIYQHFPRVNREVFIERMSHEIKERLSTSEVVSFRTARVVFFLIAQPEHAPAFDGVHEAIGRSWNGDIDPTNHFDI